MSEEEITKMLNCFPQIEIVKYILNLQEENTGLRIVLKETTHCYDEEEHLRLKNILTEFEKWLKEKIERIERVREMSINSLNDKFADEKSEKKIKKILENGIKECDSEIKTLQECLDKLQELKEGKK